MCSGWGKIIVPNATVTDTFINYAAINGENGLAWNLYRNNTLISDSHFTVTVPFGDTARVQIDY